MSDTGFFPRRWSAEIDGIRWLPRMIDKARMSLDGRLGAYLIGHSPVDKALLERLGVSTEEFIAIVGAAKNDAVVLAALRLRGFDDARVRRWSAGFERRYRTFIHLWDVDEGYVPPNALERRVLRMTRRIEAPLMSFVRKTFPRP